MARRIAVIGAGIVGVTTALELQERGHEVLLIDRKDPGLETSFGNAGVISVSSVLNVNNPGIWRQLPRLLKNKSANLSYDPAFLRREWRWVLSFLRYAANRHVLPTARALRELQLLSLPKHKSLIARAGVEHLLRTSGWMKVYRTGQSFRHAELEREVMRAAGVPFSVLSPQSMMDLEPSLLPVFNSAVLIPENCSVLDPLALTTAYMNLFALAGGQFIKDEMIGMRQRRHNLWSLELKDAGSLRADDVIIATGPWAPDNCRLLGYSIPMLWERGYHAHLERAREPLRRPVLDVDGGFVMAPQRASVRITTGVELKARDAPPDYSQIRNAVESARTAADFGRQLDRTPWIGCRPTMPDSLPVIGAATRHPSLWFNFGHQHIGLSVSSGSAMLLADLMEKGKMPVVDPMPFRPDRFQI